MSVTIFEPPSHPHNEHRREVEVSASGALDTRDDHELQRIVRRVRQALGTSCAAVSVVHRDWQYVIAADGVTTGVTTRRTSFCGHAIVGDDPVFCVPDATADARFAGNPSVVDKTLRFYAGALLHGADRLPLGTLCVFDPLPRDGLTATQHDLLCDAADAVVARLQLLRDG